MPLAPPAPRAQRTPAPGIPPRIPRGALLDQGPPPPPAALVEAAAASSSTSTSSASGPVSSLATPEPCLERLLDGARGSLGDGLDVGLKPKPAGSLATALSYSSFVSSPPLQIALRGGWAWAPRSS